MSDHWHHASSHIDPHGERPSRPETSVSYRTTRLSLNGRAVLIQSFDAGCHFPTREQKEVLLRKIQKTDPWYSLSKLSAWFTNRRRLLQEPRQEQKDEEALNTLLDSTTSLAREMWPSLSADTLHRLHNMLLEQPHLTDQHRDILASHFGVERKHVENFIKWRVAYLHPENSPQRGHRPLPSTPTDDDIMDMDELSDPPAHLPTPAGSISPEPLYRTTPFARSQMHPPPSVDTTSPLVSGEHGFSWPYTPGSITSIFESYSHPHTSSPLRTTSKPTPSSQANTPVTTHFPSPPSPKQLSRSPAKPTQFSPSSLSTLPTMLSSLGDTSSTTPTTGQEDSGRAPAGAAPSKPPQASASPAPRTLRDFEEAYAPTYARIEQFLRNVERGKYAHIGLTPEMLKETES